MLRSAEKRLIGAGWHKKSTNQEYNFSKDKIKLIK
jgi:hypothetical protein